MSNLQQFLKQHSVIPNPFIDSFLAMYNPETLQTDFVVDADNAAKWLGVDKKYLLRAIYGHYKQNIDYIITNKKKERTAKYGGNRYKHVLLTPDCFKRVCMRSRSKNAEEVRTYFIELESLLVRYRSTLLQGMQHEIKLLDKGLLPSMNKITMF
jgi:phage anti-repressor protein